MTDAGLAPNYRFAEYTTSGAFTLTLTRNQVALLAQIASGGVQFAAGSHMAALERKGLIEAVAKPEPFQPDHHEWRATAAGLLCAGMLVEAGLTSGPRDALAGEVAALKADVEDRRQEAFNADRRAWCALAKLEKVESDLNNERAGKTGGKLSFPFRRRDHMPDVSSDALRAMIPEGARHD